MNWQTRANFTQKRRKSLFAVEEGVILLPAEIRRFRGSFRDNRSERYQGVSGMDGKLGEHLPVRNRNGTLAYLLRRVGAQAWEMDDRFPNAPSTATPFVYFIGGDTGAIKIGLTTDLPARVKALKASSPIPLRVLAAREGSRMLEQDYHLLFAASRLHGEWFERSPELMAEIARLNGGGQ